MTKPVLWQREHKMHLKLCWPNPSHASGDTKCISTCVTKRTSQQFGYKMYLNMRWPNHFQKSEHMMHHNMCYMPANTQTISKYMLTKPVSLKEIHKIHLNLCWPKTSHSSEDKKCISICVDRNPSIHWKTTNVSQLTQNLSHAKENTNIV